MFIRAITGRAAVLAAAAAACALAFVVACSSSEDGGPAVDSGAGEDALNGNDEAGDGGADSAITGRCADTFGSALTEGFGRIDGMVYAVQKPSDTACAIADPDRLVLQVLMAGDVYRLVVDVGSDRGGGDAKVRVASLSHGLPAPEYAEGWQTGIPLDYANILGVHSADGGFATLTPDEAVAKIAAELKVGDPVSVYAISSPGRPESAERVQRNTPTKNEDGAIVVGPTSGAPKFLLFHFANQTF